MDVSTPFQLRRLLFIVRVKTITEMNIEYAYISEEVEEINAARWAFHVIVWG